MGTQGKKGGGYQLFGLPPILFFLRAQSTTVIVPVSDQLGKGAVVGQTNRFPICGSLLLCACLLLPGCGGSIQPLVDKEHIAYDNALLGTWTSKNCIRRHWNIDVPEEKLEEKFCTLEITEKLSLTGAARDGYLIILTDEKGYKEEIEGKLIDLGGQLFLDTMLGDDVVNRVISALPVPHMLPIHIFWKITVGQDNISTAPLNEEWARMEVPNMGIIADPDNAIPEFILTAPRSQLQELLRKNANNPEAFSDKFRTVWNRVPGEKKESERGASESFLSAKENIRIINKFLGEIMKEDEPAKPEAAEGGK